ncbi:MAG: hypothetical protein V1729_06725 [Candidatus Woesearchaeota archaeon]
MSFRPTSLKGRVRAISLAGILAAIPMYSCATSQSVQDPAAVKPVVLQSASVASAPVAAEPVVQEPCDPGQPAGKYLESGFDNVQKNDLVKATRSFECAIATGNLNDAGSALAYWHIGVGYINSGKMDIACEAFSAFIMYSSDLLKEREDKGAVVDPSGNDFVTSFGLEEKLDQARATLSVEWAKKVDYFGRSERSPIPVRNEREMMLFFGYVHDCFFKHFERTPVSEGSSIERVSYGCREDGFSAEYYFDFLR